MSKIKEKELQADYISDAAGPEGIATTLDPKVFEVYSKFVWQKKKLILIARRLATLLKRWKSGRLPRAVKIIPLLDNWEEVLWVTRPEDWSLQVY